MTDHPDLPNQQLNRIFACIAGVSVALLGSAALAGWLFQIDALKCIVPGATPLKPNIAAGMLFCGVGLSLLSSRKIDWMRSPITLMALLAITLAVLTLGEIFFGWDIGIDQLLVRTGSPEANISQRMFPTTAFCFLLAGIAILAAPALHRKRLRVPMIAGLGATLGFIGALALSGFLLEAMFGPQWNLLGMNISGISASVGFMMIGGGLLALLQSKDEIAWSLDSLTTAGFIFGVLLMFVAAGVGFNFTKQMLETTKSVTHRQEVLKEIQEITSGMANLASRERVYIITGNAELGQGREQTKVALDEDLVELRKLTSENPNQQRRLDQLRPLITQRIDWEEKVIVVRREQGFPEAAQMLITGPGLGLSHDIDALLMGMQSEEYRFLEIDGKQAEMAATSAFQILPLGVFLSLVLLSLVLFFLNSGMDERKNAERSLRHSEERMRAILDSALDCIITMDHQGRVVEFNPAAEKTFGYRRDEAIGQLLSDLIIPQALRERHQKGLAHYLSTGEAAVLGKRLELTAVRRDECEFPVELAIVRIGKQQPPMFTGFIRDITERKRAEELLRQAEEKYRGIFENALEGIFQTTPDGGYVSVNPALARIYGYRSPEELVTSVSDIGQIVYVNPGRRTEFKRLIETQGSLEKFEYEVYRKDGSRVWLSENARAVRDANGTVIYYEGAVQDITERKRSEDALRQAEEKYRDIVENAVEGVFQTTPDGRFITANLALARLLGFDSPRELIDARSDIAQQNYVDPRSREEFKRLLEEHGSALDFELEVYRKDGNKIWLSENVRAVRDENGAVVYYEGTAEDITKRKRVEDALRASEAHLQTVVENLDEGVIVSDMEGKLLHWNRAALRLHGYADSAQDRRRFDELTDTFELSTLDGAIVPVEQWPLARILGGENLGDLELQVRRIGSDWRRIFNYGGTVVHDDEKRPLMAIVTLDDITERKKSEGRLLEQADIINRAQDAIIIRDFRGEEITFWNKGAEHLYGWSAAEALGKPIDELIFADEKEREAPLKTLPSTGEFHGELKQVAKDGREIIADCRATVIHDADGEPRSVLLINTDVTEQKKLETHLLRAQRLESIGTLASGVAHDLNNILTPILMCAETLRDDLADEDRQSAISLIEESARRGAGVVKQVLTFARGIEGERVLIKPSHLIEEMIDIARQTFPKSIEVRAHYSDKLCPIQGDPTQLHQILLNLSVNARDAMPIGGSLTLAAENFMVDEHYAAMTPDAKVGPYVVLRVSDSGAGMPRATIDKIFDPFFTTKEFGKGTGLGLSTTLGIVKSHGGFISVYSELGKGTTFKIFLPARMTDEDLEKSKAAVPPGQGNGEQILIVDDEASILRVTKMIFEKHNYRVLAAHDGPEALALFAQQMNSIGGVLTDIAMPYMNGVALVRALRKMKSDTPIVASTGQDDQLDMAELQSLGVKNFLTKPYSTEKLLKTLKTAMGTQAAL
jgi:PAS domain S-box-containing protein